jgi:hypothetical protein
MKRRKFVLILAGAFSVALCVCAAAQEGYFMAGHSQWHQEFYSKLTRKDGGSCCNRRDCRPTESRMTGNHYEVKVDGEWMRVPNDTIMHVTAPDRGAHVCAPLFIEGQKPEIYCVVLPPEG